MSRQKTPVGGGRLPGLGSVLRAQVLRVVDSRKLGLGIALGLMLLQVAALAGAGVLLGIQVHITRDGEAELGLRVDPEDEAMGGVRLWTSLEEQKVDVDPAHAAAVFCAVALAIWGFFWPFRTWRGERPSRRAHHWSMPVDHRVHDLLRLSAGLLWLLAIEVVTLASLWLSAAIGGRPWSLAALSPWVWLQLLLAPVLLYLLVSIPLLRTERAVAWLWGTLGSLFALWSLVEAAGLVPVGQVFRQLFTGPMGIARALGEPLYAQMSETPIAPGRWLLALGLWLALATIGVWLVSARRPRKH